MGWLATLFRNQPTNQPTNQKGGAVRKVLMWAAAAAVAVVVLAVVLVTDTVAKKVENGLLVLTAAVSVTAVFWLERHHKSN